MKYKKIKKELEDKDSKLNTYENKLKYGEFVSSYFGWVSSDTQKQKVRDLENIEKERKNKKKEI